MEFMDRETMESLDFQYILNRINVKTPYGNIYKNKMIPFVLGEEGELIEELKKIEGFIPYAKDEKLMEKTEGIFRHIKDLRPSIKRAREGGLLSEVELFEIKNFLFLIRELEDIISAYNISLTKDMEIKPIGNLEKLLDPESTGIATFYIYDSYSKELKKIRENKKSIGKEIKKEKKHLIDKIQQELNLKLNLDGTITIPKDKIELIEKLENYFYLTYISETYMHMKYSLRLTDHINRMERDILILKKEEEKEEVKIKEYLSQEIGKSSKLLFKNIASIGKIDFILAKVVFGIKIGGIIPKVSEEFSITIIEGRHPQIEELLKDKGLEYTPISINLKRGVACITGANMGGKTLSLKLVGLLTAMAQYGLMIPAKEMKLGLNNFIKTSIGDPQSIDRGLSTFGGEIRLIREAIDMADEKGLILIDELASGTNPREGYAISKAIVEYLLDKDSITLFTTHYDNIANNEDIVHLQVIGLSNANFKQLKSQLKESNNSLDIINKHMDYRLRIADKSKEVPKDAINIGRMMGLNEEIVKKASAFLNCELNRKG